MTTTAGPRRPTSGPDATPSALAARPTPAATKQPPVRPVRVTVLFAVLVIVLALVSLASAALGQYGMSFGEVASSVLHKFSGPLGWGHPIGDHFAEATLWQVRMPRVVLALLVGAALACAGALMQGVFGNPLADPGVVGVSSGAALGAAFAIMAGYTFFGEYTVAGAAFVTGLAATLLVYLLSRSGGRTEVVTLVLTGIAVNAVAGAGLAFCMYFSDQAALVVTAAGLGYWWQLRRHKAAAAEAIATAVDDALSQRAGTAYRDEPQAP